jgi:ribosome-associated protein
MAKKKAAKKSPEPVKPEGEILARAAADYADNKKAVDILVMDLRGLSTVTDYMVLCSVDSMPQLRAVRDEVWDEIEKNHLRKPLVADTNMESLWLVLHYGDVMVHIFHKEKRSFYSLEELWGDAPRLDWAPTVPVKKRAPRKAAKKAAKKAAQ